MREKRGTESGEERKEKERKKGKVEEGDPAERRRSRKYIQRLSSVPLKSSLFDF